MKSMRMRQVGNVACMEEERKVYKILVEKPKEREVGRPHHDWNP
jgi:hypothetical protein